MAFMNTTPSRPSAPRRGARGRRNAEKRLTFSDLGRTAYLLGAVGKEVVPDAAAQDGDDDAHAGKDRERDVDDEKDEQQRDDKQSEETSAGKIVAALRLCF